MPTNNILLFDQNKGNMMGDTEYNTNQQRLNGVQSGIASSQLQNKFQYQISLVAYAIASLMYNNGLDANDADAVSAFVSNLSGTLVQKVLDKASTSEAQAGTVDTKWMSPALVKAAIDFALANPLTISGNTTFTGTVSGPTPTLDSHLTPKSYVDSALDSRINISVIKSGTLNINTTINTSNPYTGTILTMSNSELQSMFNKHIIVEFNLNLTVSSQYAFMIYLAGNSQNILLDVPENTSSSKKVNMKVYVNTSQYAYVDERNSTIDVGKNIKVIGYEGSSLYPVNLFTDYNKLSIKAQQERQSSSTINGSISARILGFEYLTSN